MITENYVYALSDYEFCVAADENAYFRKNVKYYLFVVLSLENSYYDASELDAKGVTIKGLGNALFVANYTTEVMLCFELPAIKTGESVVLTAGKQTLSAQGYQLGAPIASFAVSLSADSVGSDNSNVKYYVNDVDFAQSTDLFATNQAYEIGVCLSAAQGYSFFGFTADDITFKGGFKLIEFY